MGIGVNECVMIIMYGSMSMSANGNQALYECGDMDYGDLSSWLFNIYIDGCMREVKTRVGSLVAKLKVGGLFTDGTIFMAERERMLQRIVDEFGRVYAGEN